MKVNFKFIARVALTHAIALLQELLPDGKMAGREWCARNPRRSDKSIGSFRINVTTGRWADFASGERGGDLISLYAYLRGLGQREAAKQLAKKFGVK